MPGEATNSPQRIGPYRIIGEIGAGGMGVVYHARREGLDRDVALKVLRPEWRDDPAVAARFRREAAAAAAVAGHPGLVAVHDAGVDDGLAWCAMEYIDGRPLDDVIAGGDLAPHDAARIMEEVARALEHIHGLGILHRDLKPANILIAADGRALVADFGLASIRPAGPDVTRLTHSNLLIGTPSYMPPEQITGEATDPTADVYAAGATLYEALCGVPPHAGDSIAATLQLVLRGDVRPPRRIVPGVPAPLAHIAMQCLARDPARRYPTALALAEDLARFRRGEPVRAAGGSALARAVGTIARRRTALAVVAVGLAIVGGAGGLWTWSARSERTATTASRNATSAGREAELDAAYAALELQTLADLRTLEDHFHGRPVPEADRSAAMAQIARVCDEMAHADPSTTLPTAWHGLALCFAGNIADGKPLLNAACAGATDPFAFILRARFHLARFVRAVRIPAAWLLDGRAQFLPEPETAEMIAARLDAAHDLATAAAMPVAARLARGKEYAAFHGAIQAYLNDVPAKAIALFETVAEDTPLEQEARVMLGQLYYREERFDDAAIVFTRAAERGWERPMSHAGTAWFAHAIMQSDDAAARLRAYERSREARIRLLTLYPGDAPGTVGLAEATLGIAQERIAAGRDADALLDAVVNDCTHVPATGAHAIRARLTRATAHMVRSNVARTRGTDLRPHLRASIEDHRWIVARLPKHPKLWRRLGMDLALLARQEAGPGTEQLELFDQALVAYEQAARLAPGDAQTLGGRALVRHYRGSAMASRGADPLADWADALAATDQADAAQPGDATTARLRLNIWRDRCAWLQRGGRDAPEMWTEAVAVADRAIELSPLAGDLFARRATLRMHLAERLRRDRRDPEAVFADALADFDRALQLAPGNVTWLGNRASVQLQLGWYANRRGEDAAQHWTAGLADAEAAIAAQGDDDLGHAVKIDLLERLGRPDEALAAADAAVLACPGDRALARTRDELRARLGR